jgi:hypothetical protein
MDLPRGMRQAATFRKLPTARPNRVAKTEKTSGGITDMDMSPIEI